MNTSRFLAAAAIGLASIAVAAGLLAFPSPAAAQLPARPRAVVLRFEGSRAEPARRAAIQGLEGAYELLDEQVLIDTAAQIRVDVSTPEGMASVVEHLNVQLVIGGFIEGAGRRATTTVWVMDIRGNELSRRTTSAPTGRQGIQDIAAAASEAAAESMEVLHRAAEPTPPPVAAEVAPVQAPVQRHSMLREEPPPPRWNQQMLRALVGLRIRNRTAAVAPNTAANRFDADFFPDIQLMVEARPFAEAEGAERGLYLSLSGGFSAGLSYFRVDGQVRDMLTYNFELGAGYGLVLAEMVELVLGAGFGIDGFDLSDGTLTDFPSAAYTYVRPAVQGRIRILPPHVLVAEVGFGGRIAFDSGGIQRYGPGGTSSGGIDFFLGLAGTVDPGFSWAVRFAYQSYFLGFSGLPGFDSGTDESVQFWLMVGWAF
jgi:hypothetical protein